MSDIGLVRRLHLAYGPPPPSPLSHNIPDLVAASANLGLVLHVVEIWPADWLHAMGACCAPCDQT